MRWRFCSLLLVACTSSTVRYFLPSPENPRFTYTRASTELTKFLRVQCGDRVQTDTTRVAVRVRFGNDFDASRAQLLGSTGDETLDGLLGTISAQLRDSTARPNADRPVVARVRCAGTASMGSFAVDSARR